MYVVMKVVYIVVRHLVIFVLLRKFLFKEERGELTQQSLASLHTILHVVQRNNFFLLTLTTTRNRRCVSLMSTQPGDLL